MPRTPLAVLVPSRSRPHNVRRLLHASQATSSSVDVIVGADEDDPELDAYLRLGTDLAACRVEVLPPPPRRGFVAALNLLAKRYVDQYEMVAFLGDDHLPRTVGWDTVLCDAIRRQGGGIAYGDDLLQHDKLPTAVVMDANIPRTLGYLAPPTLWHLYADSVWLLWGQTTGQLTYRSDVVIEHLHPGAGTGLHDDGYATTGSTAYDIHDRHAFDDYCCDGLPSDVARLRR